MRIGEADLRSENNKQKMSSTMKQRTIRLDARLCDAAMTRLSDVGFNNLNFAVEYFLAECVVREKVPSFLRDKRRSCPVCKFYDPIHAKEFAELQKRLRSKAKGGKVFTALLHPTREGGYWCEIPAFAGCCSQGSTLEEAKHMIKDAALGWLDMDEVRLRYRVEREGERDSDLLMFNTPEAAREYLEKTERRNGRKRLLASASEARAGQVTEHELIEPEIRGKKRKNR